MEVEVCTRKRRVAVGAIASLAAILLLREVEEEEEEEEVDVRNYGVGRGVRLFPGVVGGIGAIRTSNRTLMHEFLQISEDDGWISRVRMTKSTFLLLTERLRAFAPLDAVGDTLLVQEHVFTFLMYMCTNSAYRLLVATLGIPCGTIANYVSRTIQAMLELKRHEIRFPVTEAEMETVAAEFSHIHKLPGCIGFIDGTHTRIRRPLKNGAIYDGFKGVCQCSQIVCDARGFVTAMRAGYPGKTVDAAAIRRMPVYLMREQLVQRGKYLIGDAGYALTPWLLPAIRETSAMQDYAMVTFNQFLSCRRVLIERVIGHIKGRCKRLTGLCEARPFRVSSLVACACVLHNFCGRHNDRLPECYVVEPDVEQAPLPEGLIEVDTEDYRAAEQFRQRMIQLFNTPEYVDYRRSLRDQGLTIC